MANPTTNFGWVMPTNTDLVTDLPADFNVFGQAVDTSMAQLKGGTTGQILSKTSATDMAFTWIANDQGDITGVTATSPLTGGGTSGAITVGIQDATTSVKGSVQLSDSTSTTSSVLAATPTAVKSAYDLAASAYAAGFTNSYPAGKNRVLNSNFSTWQRGTSIAVASSGVTQYMADRFCINVNSTTWTVSRQATSDTTNLPNIQYCARIQRNNTSTATNIPNFSQSIETVNSIPMAGKTITWSYYARVGANYSGTTTFNAYLNSGTGTDQNALNGFTGSASVIATTPTLTTTWQRFSASGTVSTSATQLGFGYYWTPSGTAGANDYVEITGVQIEVGSTASPYAPNSTTYQGELAACQRYYRRFTANSAYGAISPIGTAANTGLVYIPFAFGNPMRTTTWTFETGGTLAVGDGTNSISSITSFSLSSDSSVNIAVLTASKSASFTAFRPYYIQAFADANAYLAIGSEL